jgi:hypothetical protein
MDFILYRHLDDLGKLMPVDVSVDVLIVWI